MWVDSLSREMLETGELKRLIHEDAVVGVTSNPTIFEKALSTGEWYDAQLRAELERSDDTKQVFFALAIEDIKRACDVLRPVWERTEGIDGFVSIEVDPDLAYEREATFEQARAVDGARRPAERLREDPGHGSGRRARSRTRSPPVARSTSRSSSRSSATPRWPRRTCAGSSGSSRRVAIRRTSRRSRASSSRASTPRPTAASRRSAARICRGGWRSHNAKLAYEHYLEVFSGPRWEALAAAGARPQRCLWASTSTKNPAYRDVLYVEELIGPDTVNTMPFETIAAFQDHGVMRDTLTEGMDEAHELLKELAAAGVDYDDVTDTLEREGVQKFSDSFASLLEGIDAKRAVLIA